MLKVAMLSAWHVHTDEYARKFLSREDATLTVFWDEIPERGKEYAAKYNIDFEPDLDKLLARPDVDAVCVDAPTSMHRDVMVAAAKAGKHIFTEKILALTSAECEDIRKAVEDNNVKFCISFPHRTFPHNLFAKKVLDQQLLGTVTYLRMRNAHSGASAGWLPAHFYDESQCGGGAMIDLGAHPMYLIPWLMGNPVEVSSTFTQVMNKGVEDNAVSVMKFANGAIAVSETGFVTSNSPVTLEIHGTAGSLVISNGDVRLISSKVAEGDFGGWITPAGLPQPIPDAITQFVEGVLYGKEIIFGMDDALVLTKMMEAAYKSHKQGGAVKW